MIAKIQLIQKGYSKWK